MPSNAASRADMGSVVERIETNLDLLRLHESCPGRYPHLLQSAASGPQARYDILFTHPEHSIYLTGAGQLQGHSQGSFGFLDALDREWAGQLPNKSPTQSELPFLGGWFLYLGYELAAEIEPRLRLSMPPPDCPIAIATRVRSAVIRDHAEDCVWLVCETDYASRLLDIKTDIERLTAEVPASVTPIIDRLVEDDPNLYLDWVRKTLRYIVEGDVFQANLARRWLIDLQAPLDPAALYRLVRAHNPGPFNGLARWGDHAVISSSPERLVRVVQGRIETRPIAGTRPRGRAGVDDQLLSAELMAHPKERAEHIMLIDLERNDLGRVCQPGSIQVDELMALESYAQVHHIVSNIHGQLRPNITPGQVIRALFPGGTITGCPKVRCMEIIAELENRPRGAYTGSIGYLNRNGDMDLNILIRTFEQRGRRLELLAGAGIVADSVPARELAETRAKARALLQALGLDVGEGP